jgi:UDP-3-O-[3-hydroxymyristoyl] glucosamine N-acyltransferase
VRKLESTSAGAVLLDADTDAHGHTVIRLADPYAAFARAQALFHPLDWPEPGVDPQARVAPDAEIDGATVEAFAWVGPGAKVGAGSWIEAGAYVGRHAVLGERCRLMPHSVVYEGCRLGDRVWLNPGAVVGGEGFGFAPTPTEHVKIPQVGRVVVEDDVEIGSNSCLDRGAVGDTVVRRGAKLDNLVQLGHGVEVGEMSLLVAYTGISGSTKLGKGVVMAARSGTLGHLEIGDGVQVSAQSIVTHDLPDGARVSGYPALDHKRWLRAITAFGDLPDLVKKLRRLEKRVAELEAERTAAGES